MHLYPALWGGLAQGALGLLANTLMLIKFYAELANYSSARQPIADACRCAQLWLRDCKAREAIAFLNNSPLLPATRIALIEQIESFLNPVALKKKFNENNINVTGTDVGDRKLFNHFLYWGSFCISGQTGNVHHPELTRADITDAQLAAELNDDRKLDIEFERDILRLEGKEESALKLDDQIFTNKVDSVVGMFNKIRESTAPYRKAVMDAIDRFDKTFLDQDPDEIQVSDSDRYSFYIKYFNLLC